MLLHENIKKKVIAFSMSQKTENLGMWQILKQGYIHIERGTFKCSIFPIFCFVLSVDTQSIYFVASSSVLA